MNKEYQASEGKEQGRACGTKDNTYSLKKLYSQCAKYTVSLPITGYVT